MDDKSPNNAADNNSDSSAIQPSTKAASVSTPMPAKALPANRQTSIGSVLLLLIVILGAGVSGFLWWQGLAAQRGVAVELGILANRLDALSAEQRETQDQNASSNAADALALKQLEQRIGQQQQQITSQQQRLIRLSTTDRTDWLLAEVEYLMRLANQRLLMSQDVRGAAQLLNAADAILHELDDSALFGIRQKLAEEISALKAAAQIDVEGIYLKIQASADQAVQLRLYQRTNAELPPAEDVASQDWRNRLSSGFARALEKLKGYVRIRRNDNVFEPLIAPEYEQILRQSLHLQFEQAQSALLAGNEKLYVLSLQKTHDWIERYYQLDSTAVNALLGAINELKARPVSVEVPDISGSLRALKKYIATMHQLPEHEAPGKTPIPADKNRADTVEQTGTGEPVRATPEAAAQSDAGEAP